MVRIVHAGVDDTPTDAPWYVRTTFICPRCLAQFRLDEGDFLTMEIPEMEWNKTDAYYNPITYVFNPDAIRGGCPHCGYAMTVNGPYFGLAKPPRFIGPPVQGGAQARTAAGATRIKFVRTQMDGALPPGAMVGIWIAASGAPYGLNSVTGMCDASIRLSSIPDDFDTAYRYLLTTPSLPLTVAQARALDPVFCAFLEGAGVTLIQ